MRTWRREVIRPEKPYKITPHIRFFSLANKPNPWIFENEEMRRLVPFEGRYYPLVVKIQEDVPRLEILYHPDLDDEYALRVVKHVFSTDVSYDEFLKSLEGYPTLRKVAEKYLGLRPLKDLSIYESLIKIVLQQRISLRIALNILVRLIYRYSRQEIYDGCIFYSFLIVDRIAKESVEEIKEAGLTRVKARAIKDIAERQLAGDLPDLDELNVNPYEWVEKFMEIYGVGRWTAELSIASVLRDYSIAPAGDLNVMKGFFSVVGIESEEDIRDFVKNLRKWKGLIMYLLALEAKR